MARVARYGQAVGNYLRKYPLAPRYRRAERSVVRTADGVPIAVARLEGPPHAAATVVLVHGFVNSSRSPKVFAFAHRLAEEVHVVVPDLRGHGASGGVCTMGRLEALDVAAAASLARPDLPVVTIGTSLGGAAVLLHAGTHGGVAGVFAVSAPGWWEGDPQRPGTRRLRQYVDSPTGRQILARVLRTRLGLCDEDPYDADAAVAAIAPAFTIVVHDPEDSYFGPEHAEHLYAVAGEPKDLWWYRDAGHGTDLLTPEFAARVLAEISLRVPAPSR